MAPTSTEPREWHRYVRSARSFAESQDRMEEAVRAGVDLGALMRAQERRS